MTNQFEKMISTLVHLEQYLRRPPRQKGKRASDVHDIRIQLDENVGKLLGKKNPTLEGDIEYIEAFNYYVNNEDFGLDENDLFTTLNALRMEEKDKVIDSMRKVIQQSESIINRYNSKTK